MGVTDQLARMELGSWTIFSLLDREFIAQVRLCCVFGNLGNEALIVTRDNEVLLLGATTLVVSDWETCKAL